MRQSHFSVEMPGQLSVEINNDVVLAWGKALACQPNDIDTYLRWYFSSFMGFRPKTTDLAGQFVDARFPRLNSSAKLTAEEATTVLDEVGAIEEEFRLLEKLKVGEWPYETGGGVTQWDKGRLGMLVLHLKHSNAMPLLMALFKLKPKMFAEAVAMLERFVFRYRIVGNAHISPATDVYLRQAKQIREASGKFKLNDLRTELQALITKHVPDTLFATQISELKYSPRAGNGRLRYLLIATEDYLKWYQNGATGVPSCTDKTRVFDFDNTTLEHIYPQKAQGTETDNALEAVKQSIGNLTIFGPEANDKLANASFEKKKKTLLASNLQINRDVGTKASWSKDEVEARAKELGKMAVKIFMP